MTILLAVLAYYVVGVVVLAMLHRKVLRWAWLRGPKGPMREWRGLLIRAIVWPVVVVLSKSSMEWWGQPGLSGKPITQEQYAFVCRGRQDLLQRVEADEEEKHALVDDPLGRVPPLPFGHFNAGWRAFRDRMQAGDELWRFAVAKGETLRRRDMSPASDDIHGYALLRGDQVTAEFVCEAGEWPYPKS
jgi:hypothetical protein